MTAAGAAELVRLREELERSRKERVELAERWLRCLEAFIGDDATLMRLMGEQRENVAEFPQVVEALPDDSLGYAKPCDDRVFFHAVSLIGLAGRVKRLVGRLA